MSSTFSETWYQIAPLRLGLLPSVQVHKQVYRGCEWYVLQDSGSGKFYRLQPVAYRFACELNPKETVAEVWQRFVERYPEDAPGQQDVVQLLSQLHHANCLFFRSDADNHAIFKRFQKQRTREHLGKLMAFLYLRVPLWDPEDFLKRWRTALSPLFSTWAFAFWCAVVLVGAKTLVENWDLLWQQGQGILSLSNLPLLFISVFVLKIFHEMGHAVVCKKYGGQVHTMGIMFIVFTPLPYMDATASWSMRNRWHRTFVGGAGMYVELFFAALAALVWANTGAGLVHSMAFNIMVAGSVSSILFNGNPLLRFDAYFMLTDAIDMPNLYQKANQQWLYYMDRWLLGTRKAESQARSASEVAWLTGYGALSLFYRLFIMIVIVLMVADIWLGLGLVMLIMMAFVWVLIPLYKLFKYLLTSAKLQRNRTRAWWVSLGGLGLAAVITGAWPLPYSLKAPGVVEVRERVLVFSGAGGRLMDLLVENGEPVSAGQVLMRFSNDELALERDITVHQMQEAEWRYRQALDNVGSDPEPFIQQRLALQERLTSLEQRLAQLELRAPVDGIWHGEDLRPRLHSTVPRGERLGQVMDTGGFRFVAVVPQSGSAVLFDRELPWAQVRLAGQSGDTLHSEHLQFIPFQRYVLPSPALGVQGGGNILTRNDGTGRELTQEAFFEVIALLPDEVPMRLHQGVTGYLRIPLESRPLAWQVRQSVMQMMQRRYQL